MKKVLRKGDAVSASTVVAADPGHVYDVVSDVRRIPEWSPECVRVEVVDEHNFRGFNRRRFGRWNTKARIVEAVRGSEFAFVVQFQGADFTRWSYRMIPHPSGCLLVEEVSMCVDLPLAALLYERLALRVTDRPADLRGNLDNSLRRLRTIIESPPVAVAGRGEL